MAVDEKAFIDELIFCLDQEDIVKARALLQFASDAGVAQNHKDLK